jgi:hypothetical protein
MLLLSLIAARMSAQGNRILDFSYAGYKGGGVKLLIVRLVETIGPAPGDNTAQIQAAIDAVSKLAQDTDSLRGAVLLKPGSYEVGGTLKIGADGVVLRGSGSGEGTPAAISGRYVPAGASLNTDRVIKSISGNQITLDAPLSDSLDARYLDPPGATVVKYTFPG